METITRKKIEQSCLQTIAVEMGLKSNDLNTEMNLRDDLDIVSLDAMNIIMALAAYLFLTICLLIPLDLLPHTL